MHREDVGFTGRSASTLAGLSKRAAEVNYDDAERCFAGLLKLDDLDHQVKSRPHLVCLFEEGLEKALSAVYASGDLRNNGPAYDDSAHLFLQRVLYRINRLKLFWFDELCNYDNERSCYLREVRARIEALWQRWELAHLESPQIARETVSEALLRRVALDVSPPPSTSGLYFRHEVTRVGYRRLLAIASLDGLVEASQLSRTLGGVSNPVHSMMTRLLVEEYGGGRLNRKHSTFFAAMLTELDMRTEPEAYFYLVPWEVLAAINHSFLLSERKRFYLRYVGGLLYTETSVPAAFASYRAATIRLGMSEPARGYWDLHIREDKRHGQWMIHDVALPLAARYPRDAWEIVLGYDQQKFIADRSGASVERSARAAEREAVHRDRSNQSAA